MTILQGGQRKPAALVGCPSEGIYARDYAVQRDAFCKKALAISEVNGYCLIRGPCRTGKTSALQLIKNYVHEHSTSPETYFFSCADIDTYSGETFDDAVERVCRVTWARLVAQGRRGDQLIYLFIDSAQYLYDARYDGIPFLKSLKSLSQASMSGDMPLLRVFLAPLFGCNPSGVPALKDATEGTDHLDHAASPVEWERSAVIDVQPCGDTPGLAFTPQEYEELLALWREKRELPNAMKSTELKDHLYYLADGLPGLIVILLDKLAEKLMGEEDISIAACNRASWSLLHGPEKLRLGSFRGFMGYSAYRPKDYEIVTAILQSPVNYIRQESLPEHLQFALLKLKRRGLLRHLKPHDGDQLSFISPLHREYYLHRLAGYEVDPVHWEWYMQPDLRTFLLFFLPRLSTSLLHDTLSLKTSGKTVEALVQQSFLGIARRTLPASHDVCCEVRPAAQSGRLVDFFIHLRDHPYSPEWAMEFLADGDKSQEDADSFSEAGPNSPVEYNEQVLVDLREKFPSRISLKRPNFMYVVFSRDYATASIL